MKARTNEFKEKLSTIYENKNIVTYTLNNVEHTLTDEELQMINPHYEASLLKSVMKCLEFESTIDIPKETIVNYRTGLKVRENSADNYDYISYGNYVVYSSEKQEDTDTYLIKCYDKMLYSMVDYVSLNITYPITVRNYINAIATHLGLTFKNANDTFTNYDKEIPYELYLDSEGKSLGYKFRDVLDELSQVTASNIVINEADDELEVRYITETNDTINEEYFNEDNVNFGETFGPLNTIILSRSAESDEISQSIPANLPDEDKIAIKIKDNQIMNFDNRDTYLTEILNKLYGLSFTTNDYASKGILYYNVCDKYTASIFETNYSCIMLNDDVIIDEDGIEENSHMDMPEIAQIDYSKTSTTDKTIRKTTLIVDKQVGEIRAEVEGALDGEDGLVERMNKAEARLDDDELDIRFMVGNFNEDGSVKSVETETNFKFNEEGLRIGKSTDDYNSLQDNTGTYYYEKDTMTGKYTKDGSVQKDMALFGKYYYGVDEDVDVANFSKDKAMFVAELYEKNGKKVFGHFYNGG